jgi:hypothetical protein
MNPFYQSTKNKGIITNLPTTVVHWAIGRNVHFRMGAVYKSLGKELLATIPSGTPIRGLFTFRGHDGVFRTVVASDAKIYSYINDFGSYTDITPTPAPTGDINSIWSFQIIGGCLIVSNGKDKPWKWPDYTTTLVTANINITPYGILQSCGILGKSMQRLLLGNTNEAGGAIMTGRLRWSYPANPELFIEDRTAKSGHRDLMNPHDKSIDAWETIRNFGHRGSRVIIYTDRNVWTMDPLANALHYKIEPFIEETGILGARANAFFEGLNYFIGQDDIYEIADAWAPIGFDIRNAFIPNINNNALNTSFAYYRPTTKEVVFAAPVGTATTPNMAVVFQRETKGWSIIDIDFNCHVFCYSQQGYTWSTLPFTTWDEITDSEWDLLTRTGNLPYEVVGDNYGQLWKLDSGNNNGSSAIQGFIETGDVGREDMRRTILRVYPLLKPQSSSNPLMVQVGTREFLHDPIQWSNPQPVQIGVDRYADFNENGRYARFRFYTDQLDSPWILEGYGFEQRETWGGY